MTATSVESPFDSDIVRQLAHSPPLPEAIILFEGEIRARGLVKMRDERIGDFIAIGPHTLSDRTAEGCCMLIGGKSGVFKVLSIQHFPGGRFALVLE